MSSNIKKIAVIVSAIGVALFAYLCVSSWLDPFDDLRFTPKAWVDASGDLEARARMCRDIARHVVKPGMSVESVTLLLGKSDGPSFANEFAGATYALSYRIGHWSSQGMDDAYLLVLIDANSKVIRSEIWGH